MTTVKLVFDTKEQAIAFCEKKGAGYSFIFVEQLYVVTSLCLLLQG
jgi:hypothetical protein